MPGSAGLPTLDAVQPQCYTVLHLPLAPDSQTQSIPGHYSGQVSFQLWHTGLDIWLVSP